MDSSDIFRKLGFGARFDFKRFNMDAKRLQVISATDKDVEDEKENSAAKRLAGSDEESTESTPLKRMKVSNGHASSEEEDVHLLGAMKADEHLTRNQRKKRKKASKLKVVELQKLKHEEEINAYKKKHRIHAIGADVPDPVVTFHQLNGDYGLNQTIIDNMKGCGLETPTPIQMQAIPVMMERREILACAPTGSGKTAAFLLPVLCHLKTPQKNGFRALILSPTRELAKQTYRECMRISDGLGFRIHYINKVSTAIDKFGPKSSQRFDILVTTPNRLIFMLKQEPPAIDLKNIEWLIVDESDKLFEDGKTGFREQLAEIFKACDSTNVRRAFFSATFTYDVEEWCKLNLDNVVQVYIGARNSATHTIEQKLEFVGTETGKLLAIRDLIRKGFQPPVLVFVQSKDRAKELFKELLYDGINVDVIHAGRTQAQRDRVVRCFRQGDIWLLICTELMGRGIDFKGVNLVINYDFPQTAISYIHRIGRTGRAGRGGSAVTYYTEDDLKFVHGIAHVMKGAGCPVPDFMLNMKKPTRELKVKMKKSAPKRDTISTMPNKKKLREKQMREAAEKKEKGEKKKKEGEIRPRKRIVKTLGKKNKKDLVKKKRKC
ncbi:hypothetical protein CAPTEDRAFT_187719 [Capitella teleta]|uniref:Probable ATP-dependent RNA helicase DDX52 n=1 Tax=Capitella teleta TaxID=283909 RepID=R7TMB9_CAPTE|nr:hypothetical protein CAPTEDRAFT_187719 [Capitella teleta]|eukprot:ELT94682.1 hypothetical protein CAPTEDRAFT_187719 [Capitella teleta]